MTDKKEKHNGLVTVILIFLLFRGVSIAAADIPVKSEVLWDKGILRITTSVVITPEMGAPPAARIAAENLVKNRMETIFLESIGPIYLDSRTNITERMLSAPGLHNSIRSAAKNPALVSSSFDQAMKNLTVTYEYHLFPTVISPFISHTRPNPVPEDIRFYPSTRFTGIVIYILEDLPVRGETDRAGLNPSFFPAVYSETMDLVASAWMMSPETVRSWGTLGYSTDPNSAQVFNRTGPYPLRITAKAVFGVYRTDLIISTEDALKILTVKENRDLIRDGKITVILPAQNP